MHEPDGQHPTARSPQDSGEAIMTRLRTGTAALHQRAEQSAFQRALLAGELPRHGYVEYLRQMCLIHRSFEELLRRLGRHRPALGGVVREHLFRETHLTRDLQAFGIAPQTAVPLPATARFIDRVKEIAATNPIALLGVHYVFEGSTNGGRFIAKGLRGVCQLAADDGVSYFDAYGDEQPRYWREFKSLMNGLCLTAGEREAIVSAAGDAFLGMIGLFDELHARTCG